jgi:ligand-binding sensor domain-containing protein
MQDNVGYIWTGTGDGLSRYDGYRFKTFNNRTSNLSGKHVVNIYEDREDVLWVATNRGFSKFNKVTQSGLGTRLIEIFIKQLNGTATLLDQSGTMYKIIFQKNNSK